MTKPDTYANDDNLTIAQMQAKLQTLIDAMVEKGVPTPEADCTVKPRGERHYIYLTSKAKKVFDGSCSAFCRGDNFSECFTDAQQVIASLPDPADAIVQEYRRKVAAAIDFGTENSLDERLVSPLRDVSKIISEGLLTDQRGAEQ